VTEPDDLPAAIRAAALGLDVTAVEANEDGTISWSRNKVVFAVLQGGTAEFRIGRAIAEAAVRTPDTAPSGRGRDWVAFAPPMLDGHALDRLVAWFGAAHRRAVPDG